MGAASASDNMGPSVWATDSSSEPALMLRTCTTTPPRSG